MKEGSSRQAGTAVALALVALCACGAPVSDDANDWFERGRAESALKRWDPAIEAYQRALAIDPAHAKAQNNLANIHFRRGDFVAAEAAYARALEIDPDYILALFHHGWVLRQLNRADEAERAFARCQALTPRNQREQQTQFDCLYYGGTLRQRAGDWAAAAATMERVLALQPGHVEARYYLGMAYRRLGRDADAERELALHESMLRAKRRAEPVEREDEP